MRKTPCRLIAAILAAAMLMGLLPVSAMADYAPEIITFSGAQAKTYTFTETGIYHIYAYGKGGAGGDSVEFYHDDDFYGPSGGGGGSGGVCGHEAAFAAGDTLTVKFDGETLTVSGDGILLTCGSGEDGDSAYYNSDISYGAGIGGRAGTANGGNLINKSVGGEGGKSISNSLGNPGGSGGVVDSPYAEYGYGAGGNGGDGVQPGSQRQYGEAGGAPAVIIEYISPAPAVMAMSLSEPSTLAEHSIGTVFQLDEDGTLYDWILISHNYEGTGNQLLMRKDCIYYSSLPAYTTGTYYGSDGVGHARTFYTLDFCNSEICTYLNSDYITKFSNPIQNVIVETNINVINSICTSSSLAQSYSDKYLVTGTTKKPFKVFILSANEVGLGDSSQLTLLNSSSLGLPIDYFASNTERKSNNKYVLREAYGYNNADYQNVFNSISYSGNISTYVLSSLTYYRPCLVLPADTYAVAGEEITGEIIPTIEIVDVTDEWALSNTVTINATNAVAYAITTDAAEPADGWQQSSSFEVDANGTYYAWVKSETDNTASQAFTVSRVDSSPPEISSVSEQNEYRQISSITVTASDAESGISGYAVSTENDSSAVTWQTENIFEVTQNGLYYIFVKDNVGHISSCEYTAVMVDREPPVIESVRFEQDNTVMTVTAADTASGVKAITIDGTEYTGSTAVHHIADGLRYIGISVEDNAGNVSDTDVLRIPGWFDILNTLLIDSVEMVDKDNRILEITASSTVDPVFGILIDGVLHAGNPVRYTVPAGEKLLELQAQDVNGDRSEIYTHYVSGFEEEISSLAVMSMLFEDDYSSVEVTATETGSPMMLRGIRGINVNEEFLAGNPVTYAIPRGTTQITAVAVNNDGDYSPPMTKQVPQKQTGGGSGGGGDSSDSEYYSTPQLTIHQPAWTSAKTAKVYIEAKDDYGIRTIMAKTDKNGKWADITNDPYVTIDKDAVVYAYAVNWGGRRVDAQKDISCFDLEPPTMSTELRDDVLIIFAADDLSGVAGIYVNGAWHKGAEITGGFYRYVIPDSVASVSVMALDAAGNISGAVTVPVPAKPLPQPPTVIEEPEPETPPPATEPAEPEPVVTLTPQQPPEMTEAKENPPRLASVLKVVVIVAVMILLAIAAAMAWAFILQRQKKDSEQETEDDAALDVSADPPDDEEPEKDEYEVLEVIEQDSEPQAIDFESSPLGARFKSFKGDD